jgi:predicted ATP-grasp superfamily ATP-dependent carboligase
MKILKKPEKNPTVLTSVESINRITKKKVAKIILKIRVQNVPSSVKVGSFFAP